MSTIYTDLEIQALVEEPKPLPNNWRQRLQLAHKRGHDEKSLDLLGGNGSEFRLILRQSQINVLDFSIILGILIPESNRVFRLRRHNGKSHSHTNHIENETFYDFHIHMATERYQQIGAREDTYAEVTNRYSNLQEALTRMLRDVSFVFPDEDQLILL